MGTFKAAVALIVGIVVGWLVGCFYADLVSIPAAREAGRIEERFVWTKRQAEAEAKAAADRQAAQIRIDAIEREYFERDKARVLEMDALEQSLQAEQANVPTPSPAARGTPPVCRPAIPRGVRDALDAAGRALQLARLPASLLQPCADVADLPERDLTTAETARLWGRDRQSLGACRDRQAALADAAQALEGQGRASDHDGHQ